MTKLQHMALVCAILLCCFPTISAAEEKAWSKEELKTIAVWEEKATHISEALTLAKVWPEGSNELKLYKDIAAHNTVIIGVVDDDGKPTGKTRELSSVEFR